MQESAAPVIRTAAIYARQSESVPEGIARQVERCRSLAAARGWTVADEHVYPDNDTSAFKARGASTGWGRMLAALDSREVDVVIAVDLDRLLRDPRDLATIIDTGASVLTVNGEIDLTTADGEFRATMLASIARFEVRRKSERQRRANEHRVASGRPTPGRRRYGYETDGVTPREVEAANVRRMFEHVAGGGSIRSMALALAAEGVDPSPGKSWSPGRVRYILNNPTYGGALHRGGEALPSGHVVPLVSAELAEEVRAILADEARTVTPGPKPRYLASGIAECGKCDGFMFNLAHAYRCKADSAHPTIKRELLDARMRDEVAAALLVAHARVADARAEATAPLLAELRRNEAAVAATLADRDDELIPASLARTRLIELRDARQEIERRLETARVERSALSALARDAEELLDGLNDIRPADYFGPIRATVGERFAALDIDRQRDIARAVIQVTVNPGRDPRRVAVFHLLAEELNGDAGGDTLDGDDAPSLGPRARREELTA
jgi:site-specific DNA recombinase